MVLNSIKLKQLNIELVKKAMRSGAEGTKNSIADATGLSVATCGNILDELVISGEVIEAEAAPSTGGRPSRRFRYNEKYRYLLLLYVCKENGGENIHCSVTDLLGATVHEQKFSFERLLTADLLRVIETIIQRFDNISVISAGIPGVVRDGRVDLCDIDALAGMDLAELLSAEFHLPVVVENDVNSSAYGYYKNFSEAEPESLVYIFYPDDYCAGAGIVINGKVLRGRSSFAGEVGYLPGISFDVGRGGSAGSLADIAVKTVLTVNCIINPECIVISGKAVTGAVEDEIRKRLNIEAPPNHVPPVDFEQDMHESYIRGLCFAGLERLSCELEIVRRY